MPEAVITNCGNCRFFSGAKVVIDDYGRPTILTGTCRRRIGPENMGYPLIHTPDDYVCNKYKPVEEVYDNAGNSDK